MKEIGDVDFRKHVAVGAVGQVASAFIGFGASIALARLLGPSAYGLFFVVLAVSRVADNPFTGWAQACQKRMTESGFDTGQAFGSAFLAVVVGSLLGAPVVYLVLPLFTDNEFIITATPVMLVAGIIFSAANTLLQGSPKFSRQSWGTVVNTFVGKSSQLALVVFTGFGLWGMVGGYMLGIAVTTVLILKWLSFKPSLPTRESLQYTYDFAKWSIPKGFVGTALTRMDLILLGWLATSQAAGLYRVAWSLTTPALFISGAISSGMMGRVSNMKSRDESWQRQTTGAISYASALAIPLFFGSLLVGEQIVTVVFGVKYAGAGVYLVGLTLFRILSTQSRVRGQVLDGIGEPNTNLSIMTAMAVVNIVAGVALLFHIGPYGVVIATVGAQLLGYALRVSVLDRKYDIETLPRPLREQLTAGIAMYLALFWVEVQSRVALAAVIATGALFYFSVLLVTENHRRNAKEILNQFA